MENDYVDARSAGSWASGDRTGESRFPAFLTDDDIETLLAKPEERQKLYAHGTRTDERVFGRDMIKMTRKTARA